MDYIWIVVAGFLFAFFLSFSIGANDTANSFGTSVGSKVLTLRKAYILATIFETCGAILLGSKVTDTMRSGVIDAAVYNQSEKAFISGQLATLSGCGVWMMLATLFKLPVSTTHSMVGATLGYSIVLRHFQGVRWLNIGYIVASWFLSPILSGLITTVFYMTINASILKRDQAAMRGLNLLPYFYFFTFLINIFSVFYDGSAILKFNEIPFWAICLVSVVLSFMTAMAVRITVVPKLRRKLTSQVQLEMIAKKTSMEKQQERKDTLQHMNLIENRLANMDNPDNPLGNEIVYIANFGIENILLAVKAIRNTDKTETGIQKLKKYLSPVDQEDPQCVKLFSFLQILSACFSGFAHGGNDVSNSIAPLVTIWNMYEKGPAGIEDGVPIWLLAYGSAGMSIGLWMLGHRVIRTVGEGLTELNAISGFCVELAAAFTVLFASKLGLPISTTHCKIGSVVAVGYIRFARKVNLALFRNIILSWVVTLPATARETVVNLCGDKTMSIPVVKILVSVAMTEEGNEHIRTVTEIMNALSLPYTIVNGIDQRFTISEGITIETLAHIRQELFPLFFQNGAYLGNILQFYAAYWEGNIRLFFPCLFQLDSMIRTNTSADDTSTTEGTTSVYGSNGTDSSLSVYCGLSDDSSNWASSDEEDF
ncbi:hypothetical protein M514_01111 [Trichuris suis]|uniref:Phosphate transporter n=1 Tax=Trichuris suis TaxID=68888 RepID=A0A085MKY2_9BILA|nr:hypothetical protein M513_01111 [Trichuris suis]KFD62594.1 hypothetical protein M514_01111 [Trichuris suis]